MDFETLLKQWANDQGFQTWSQDHAAVLRNLGSWLNQHAAQQSAQPTGHWFCSKCEVENSELSTYCWACETPRG